MRGQSPAASGNGSDRLRASLRDLRDRLRSLEARRPNVIGDWTLSQSPSGDLIATHTDGTSVTLAAPGGP